jgi:translation initiation factor 3 subunit K
MATKESIQKLVESNRYSPDIIPELEKYVASQVANKTHDTEANLALLKLYQFYPEKNNSQVVANILLKAIMNFPSTDFMLALYLISEKTVRISLRKLSFGDL